MSRGSAKVAHSTVVVVDAFRASTTIAVLVSKGARVVEAARGAPAILTAAFVSPTPWPTGWRVDTTVRTSWWSVAAGRGATLDERARRVVEGYLTRPANLLPNNSAARRLKRLKHEQDLDLCLAEDTVPVVPRSVDGAFVGG